MKTNHSPNTADPIPTSFAKEESSMRSYLGAIALAGLVVALAWTSAALAMTASGTDIANTAVVNYKVNSIDQPQKTGQTTFKVDRRIDVGVVKSASEVDVTPGASARVLTFTVTNEGNAPFDFGLSTEQATSDEFDATSVAVYVESGANAGYQAGEDTGTMISNLAAGDSKVVYVVANIPVDRIDEDLATIHLIAQAREVGGAAITTDARGAADQAAVVDDVLADASGPATDDIARDGKHSDTSSYRVRTARITVSKSSTVVWDPVSESTNPKAIPGAYVRYTVTISNASGAGATATDVVFTDDLTAESSRIAYRAGTMKLTKPGESEKALTDASGDDEGTYNAGAETITVTGVTLAANQTATVTFEVEIQ